MLPKGCRIYSYENDDNTMNQANRLIDMGCTEGTIVLSKMQSLGKGRYDRRWLSPKGNIYMTMVLRNNVESSYAVMQAGLVIYNVLSTLISNEEIRIKWPNDILINKKKVCGIILEQSVHEEYTLLGVGMNVEQVPNNVQNIACCVRDYLSNSKTLMQDLIYKIVDGLYNNMTDSIVGDFYSIREKWLSCCIGIGEFVKVQLHTGEVSGIFRTIDNKGQAVIDVSNEKGAKTEEKIICAGDIFI